MIAVKIEKLTKIFYANIDLKSNDPRVLKESFLKMLGFSRRPKANNKVKDLSRQEKYALAELNLEMKEGCIYCLKGPSNSGKSVLLKVLSGECRPTSGQIKIRGKVASLLKSNNDIDYRLTAQENIAQYQKKVNMPIEKRKEHMVNVITFAELEEFQHQVLRVYSTGMKMRLGIALVLLSDASVFFIDDVLAVGDAGFQQKCIKHLELLKTRQCTLLFVMDRTDIIKKIADYIIIINNGQIVKNTTVIDYFSLNDNKPRLNYSWYCATTFSKNELSEFKSIDVMLEKHLRFLKLAFKICFYKSNIKCRLMVDLFKGKDHLLRTISPKHIYLARSGNILSEVSIPLDYLSHGEYLFHIGAVVNVQDVIYSIKEKNAINLVSNTSGCENQHSEGNSIIKLETDWEMALIKADEHEKERTHSPH